MRSAAYVAVLLTALLWWTQWPSLQAGIIILLLGQLSIVAFYLLRNSRISRDLTRFEDYPADGLSLLSWFEEERTFSNRLVPVENVVRTIGFAVLAYGFWVATRSTSISLLLGVVYPVSTYFGMSRKKQQRTMTLITAQREEVAALMETRRLPRQ
ncbi:MAG: hypothetical protein M3Y72_01605 [Acidobacteriota bacterium]|nr:hypothetical protein [Acidobacteriota bacterium]